MTRCTACSTWASGWSRSRHRATRTRRVTRRAAPTWRPGGSGKSREGPAWRWPSNRERLRRRVCFHRGERRGRRERSIERSRSASSSTLQNRLCDLCVLRGESSRGLRLGALAPRGFMNEVEAMDRALALALKGWGRVSPNPLVGAVLLKDGQVVGEGYHAEFGGPHAEAAALASCADPTGSTCVVTLEPCAHRGKTPPCTGALISAGG